MKIILFSIATFLHADYYCSQNKMIATPIVVCNSHWEENILPNSPTGFSNTKLTQVQLPAINNSKRSIVAGKMYFSDKPFTTSNAGSKKNFSSADYIYGRIELDTETMNQAFRVFEPNSSYPNTYILYRIYVFQNGKELGFNSSNNVCLLREKEKHNKWFNFDVLPEPAKASTVLSGTERFHSSTLGTVPLYSLISPYKFPGTGDYNIVVKFYSETYDVWGRMEPVEKWPVLEEEFKFSFKEADVPMLKKNEVAADEMIKKIAFSKGK